VLLSPFSLLQRFFTEDIASLFGGPDTLGGELRRRHTPASQNVMPWMPKIDVVQADNELVVRADLPGVNIDDVMVDVSDDAITISGTRRQEHTEEHDSVYRIERTSGSFLRVIPLPEGAIVDRATATFKEGVLEIRVPAPSEQVSRGRRLEISTGDKTGTSGAGN
jgi:HSP20 family protein